MMRQQVFLVSLITVFQGLQGTGDAGLAAQQSGTIANAGVVAAKKNSSTGIASTSRDSAVTVQAVRKRLRTEIVSGIAFSIFDFYEGDPASSIPILYFHGTSSSRIEPRAILEQIKRKKRTVISFDRPGYGLSDPVPFDSLDDYVRWSDEKLLPAVEKILGFKPAAYDLVSMSGGAQYCLRTAQRIPDRVRKVSLISAGLFARPAGQEGAFERARLLAANRPRIAQWIARTGYRNPDFANSFAARKYSLPDLHFTECNWDLARDLYLEASRQGACGMTQDARLQLCDTSYARPLPKNIQVEMWNGACDQTISQVTAKLLADRIGVQIRTVQNEGHLSVLPIAFEQSVLPAGRRGAD